MAGPSRIDELRKKFDENPRRYFAPLANEYRKIGDFEQAIFICQEFLPQQPGHMSGHIVYGQALFESGKHDEARGVFETALALDPENLIALRHLGDIARAHGDNETARGWYRRVLESDPRNEEIAGILESLDAEGESVPASAVPDGASPAAAGADAPSAPQPAIVAHAGDDDPHAITLPNVSEATSPPQSSFDDIAKLFTASSAEPSDATGSGPLELIHEGEDILGRPETNAKPNASRAAETAHAPPAMEETLPGASDSSSQGFRPTFLDGLTTPEPAAPPSPPPLRQETPAPAAGDASAAFVTETMAELYVHQGHYDQALEVYRKLVSLRPNDSALIARVRELEAKSTEVARGKSSDSARTREVVVEAGPTIRDFLGPIAEFRPRSTSASIDGHGGRASAGIEPTASASPPHADRPPQETTVGGSLHNLFADAERQGRSDEARSGNREAARPASTRDGTTEQSASIRGRPSTPAATELSLAHVFRHATPAAGTGAQSSFSFDQFFSQQAQHDVAASDPQPPSEGSGGPNDDIQQFNAWLEGLKKT